MSRCERELYIYAFAAVLLAYQAPVRHELSSSFQICHLAVPYPEYQRLGAQKARLNSLQPCDTD